MIRHEITSERPVLSLADLPPLVRAWVRHDAGVGPRPAETLPVRWSVERISGLVYVADPEGRQMFFSPDDLRAIPPLTFETLPEDVRQYARYFLLGGNIAPYPAEWKFRRATDAITIDDGGETLDVANSQIIQYANAGRTLADVPADVVASARREFALRAYRHTLSVGEWTIRELRFGTQLLPVFYHGADLTAVARDDLMRLTRAEIPNVIADEAASPSAGTRDGWTWGSTNGVAVITAPDGRVATFPCAQLAPFDLGSVSLEARYHIAARLLGVAGLTASVAGWSDADATTGGSVTADTSAVRIETPDGRMRTFERGALCATLADVPRVYVRHLAAMLGGRASSCSIDAGGGWIRTPLLGVRDSQYTWLSHNDGRVAYVSRADALAAAAPTLDDVPLVLRVQTRLLAADVASYALPPSWCDGWTSCRYNDGSVRFTRGHDVVCTTAQGLGDVPRGLSTYDLPTDVIGEARALLASAADATSTVRDDGWRLAREFGNVAVAAPDGRVLWLTAATLRADHGGRAPEPLDEPLRACIAALLRGVARADRRDAAADYRIRDVDGDSVAPHSDVVRVTRRSDAAFFDVTRAQALTPGIQTLTDVPEALRAWALVQVETQASDAVVQLLAAGWNITLRANGSALFTAPDATYVDVAAIELAASLAPQRDVADAEIDARRRALKEAEPMNTADQDRGAETNAPAPMKLSDVPIALLMWTRGALGLVPPVPNAYAGDWTASVAGDGSDVVFLDRGRQQTFTRAQVKEYLVPEICPDDIPATILDVVRARMRGSETVDTTLTCAGWRVDASVNSQSMYAEITAPDHRTCYATRVNIMPLPLADTPVEALRYAAMYSGNLRCDGYHVEMPDGWRYYDRAIIAPDGRAIQLDDEALGASLRAARITPPPLAPPAADAHEDVVQVVAGPGPVTIKYKIRSYRCESSDAIAEKGSVRMSETIATIVADTSDAAWRTAGSQFVKLARDPLVGLLCRHLGPDDPALRARVAAFLETELGAAMLAALLAAGLSALPAVAGDVPARLGRELRVRALADAGDTLADVLLQPLRQVMATSLRGLPTIDVAPAVPAVLDAPPAEEATGVRAVRAVAPVEAPR